MNTPLDKGFFVFGLQRTGTNYMQTLMEKNFIEGHTRAAWKHKLQVHKEHKLDAKIKDRAILIIHKNPYTWIESITKRKRVDFAKTQKTFPCKQFETNEEELLAINGINLAALAKTWQAHYNNWILNAPDYINRDSTIIRYEDLLDKKTREEILEFIEHKYSFTRKTEEWINPNTVHMSSTFDEKKRIYYLNGLSMLTDRQLGLINKHLRADCLEACRYRVL